LRCKVFLKINRPCWSQQLQSKCCNTQYLACYPARHERTYTLLRDFKWLYIKIRTSFCTGNYLLFIDVSGNLLVPSSKGFLNWFALEDGTDRLTRNVSKTAYLRCVTSQKSEYLIYTAAAVWNHVYEVTSSHVTPNWQRCPERTTVFHAVTTLCIYEFQKNCVENGVGI
jgi:hypothetical protein